MADTKASIFNQHAAEKLRSPDDLDRYVRVTSPAVWVTLVAVLALVVGLLSWGIFGSVSTHVSVTGTCVDGEALCLLDADQAAQVHVGDEAFVGGQQASVKSISSVPASREETSALLGSDYLVDTLMPGDWAYIVHFDGVEGAQEGVPLTVSITTESIAPISLVLG